MVLHSPTGHMLLVWWRHGFTCQSGSSVRFLQVPHSGGAALQAWCYIAPQRLQFSQPISFLFYLCVQLISPLTVSHRFIFLQWQRAQMTPGAQCATRLWIILRICRSRCVGTSVTRLVSISGSEQKAAACKIFRALNASAPLASCRTPSRCSLPRLKGHSTVSFVDRTSSPQS